ncbi:hypothetical protein LV83_00625 [Algoriphagus yeomjeoni]|uniref:Uncharacterized protein n=1 Tax=Algoriphagus yeomjeoni TaxID=291403 RepID=A0A327PV55_9BACT|nr:hypothetical protein LV83_00625 [Algoriphagus yeomjeoni]
MVSACAKSKALLNLRKLLSSTPLGLTQFAEKNNTSIGRTTCSGQGYLTIEK